MSIFSKSKQPKIPKYHWSIGANDNVITAPAVMAKNIKTIFLIKILVQLRRGTPPSFWEISYGGYEFCVDLRLSL